MSDIRFLCPECHSKLVIDSAGFAHTVTCPRCGKPIQPSHWTPLDIRFPCPKCGQRLVVTAEAAGHFAPCPNCHVLVPIPESSGERTWKPPTLTPDEVHFLTDDQKKPQGP